MPGGFWQGNALRPQRRRRSLMGRKNRSDNDLHQQDSPQSAQQQQQQQQTVVQQPITKVVLPENVKTILIAGTPECWNLSTSTEVYAPANCDASIFSELSPNSTTLTIDEDEPLRGNEGLEWLKSGTTNNNTQKPRQSPTKSALTRQQQGQQDHLMKEPSSMIVMYRSPTRASAVPPQEALQIWLNSADALLKSKEMAALVMSTRDVVQAAGGLAVKTACLPVTLPFHVVCATKDFIGWTVHQALLAHRGTTSRQLVLTNGGAEEEKETTQTASETTKQDAPATTNTEPKQEESEKKRGGNPLEGLLWLVPVVLETAGKVKDEIGSAVIAIVTPPSPKEKDPSKNGSWKNDDKQALDRLIIPGVSDEGVVEEDELVSVASDSDSDTKPAPSGATRADYTKFLLRVEDLGILMDDDATAIVLYIDLGEQFRDMSLLTRSLDKMAARGIDLATTHAPSIPPAAPSTSNPDLEWKTEGSTAKLLRKKAMQTKERWDETLRTDILIWSGNFRKQRGGSAVNQQYSLMMARGVVDRMSPREFLELMWDSNRTEEYNQFCMGREDILRVEDQVLTKKANTGVKVVKSETRVPFTGLSVTLFTVMHCRPLPGGPQEGYVILSRSLNSGMAGYHTAKSSRKIDRPKSEILWGVNVLRAVPGCPGQTELTSLSQVTSSLVPKFLSQRIGIMGVEDFFRNVRSPPKVTSPTKSCTPDSTARDAVPSSALSV
ncbi:expressed unknown protein [Seminavis robusta]|uniref:START domain-containing protein n=1 Tax=Seminavis robusta TaxID=568900 RepID=A0A9N8E2D4_9STRA|nr:expressed unknown protein [Seminavis robusta]|eukprot:Sro487_g152830.1 n/a (721) ;mRNA; r:20147-22400